MRFEELKIQAFPKTTCFWVVSTKEEQEVLNACKFSSICLNGYNIKPFIEMIEKSKKSKKYLYIVATTNTEEGVRNAQELKEYFTQNWKKRGLYSMNYTLTEMKKEGLRSICDLEKSH
jgi:hypothetical protein